MRCSVRTLVGAVALALAAAAHAEPATTLDSIEVSASTLRVPQSQGALPMTITVITSADLAQQLAITPDLSAILGNLVPAFSPSRQKLSGFGETLRGRSPLYMIDGVPQSSPLRDGSRDGYTIDPAMIERIEIVEGANSLQGLGAAGGIINIVTRQAPEADGAHQAITLNASAPTRGSDGTGYGGAYTLGVRSGAFDLVAGVSQRTRGMYSDADGRLIGVDGTQGDLMDSRNWDLFAKLGYAFGDARRLQFTVNRFQLQGDGDFVAVPGDADAGIPTTSQRGTQPGEAPRNRVLTTSLDYRDGALAGGELRAQLYHQENRELFGGGTFATFQDPALGPNVFDQSQNVSDKDGARLSWTRRGLLDGKLGVLGGIDGYRDATYQELALTGRKWVPDTTFTGWAPFLQAELWPLPQLSLSAGLRQEHGTLDVPTYRTLAFYHGVTVEGGTREFTRTLPNLGAVWYAGDHLNVFASYAQGYTLPDVGRVLRAINQPGLSVDSFLDLKPVVSDNREVGAEYDDGVWNARVSTWTSRSALGALLVYDAGNDVYNVARQRTSLRGWEARGGVKPWTGGQFALAYAHTRGRTDSNGDGRVDSDLDAANVAPDRLNLSWTQAWREDFATYLQLSRYFGRSFDFLGKPGTRFRGYTTADAYARLRSAIGDWTLGVENLANREYITYFSQTLGDDLSYFAGRGRVVSLTWQLGF